MVHRHTRLFMWDFRLGLYLQFRIFRITWEICFSLFVVRLGCFSVKLSQPDFWSWLGLALSQRKVTILFFWKREIKPFIDQPVTKFTEPENLVRKWNLKISKFKANLHQKNLKMVTKGKRDVLKRLFCKYFKIKFDLGYCTSIFPIF